MQVVLTGDVLRQLEDLAAKQGRAVGPIVEEAVREYLEKAKNFSWDGEVRRTSREHDTIYDEP